MENSFEKLSNVREGEGCERDRKERDRGQRRGERRLVCVIKRQDTMRNKRYRCAL